MLVPRFEPEPRPFSLLETAGQSIGFSTQLIAGVSPIITCLIAVPARTHRSQAAKMEAECIQDHSRRMVLARDPPVTIYCRLP